MICQKDSLSQLFKTCFFQWLPTSDLRVSALKLAYTDTTVCNCVNLRGKKTPNICLKVLKNFMVLHFFSKYLPTFWDSKYGVHATPPAARWSAVCLTQKLFSILHTFKLTLFLFVIFLKFTKLHEALVPRSNIQPSMLSELEQTWWPSPVANTLTINKKNPHTTPPEKHQNIP